MDSQNPHFHFGGGAGTTLLPVSAFSAYNLLRSCNYLFSPQSATATKPLGISTECPLQPTAEAAYLQNNNHLLNLPSKTLLPPPFFGYPHNFHPPLRDEELDSPPCSSLYNSNFRRQRGEKKPIPDEQKDEKYFERRKRNNQAAKKSRDARKIREDHIALKATILEHENAVLRAQVLTLREETSSLRQLLLQKKALETSSDTQISRS